MKNKIFLIILVIVSFIHFLWLDKVPPGMSHDEVVYALSSKSFFMKGTDITGTGFPVGLFKTQTEGNISLLPSILISPMNLFTPLSQTTARIPFVIISIMSAVAVYVIAKKLFNNEKIALITFALFSLEPWSFFLSRFAAEPPVALMFYLWAIATLLIYKGKKLVLPFLFFALGFYSYHGGKILFLPLILTCLSFLLVQKKITKKEAAYFFFGSLAVFLSFFIVSLNIPGGIVESRRNELFFLNTNLLSQHVDAKRTLTLENPLTSLFTNKITAGASIFFQKYITAFSTKVLFLQGDPRLFYAFLYHGLLYIFDALFIPLGFIFVFLKNKKVGLFIFGLLLIAPLPSAVSGIEDSYINRSSLLLVVFSLISAYGIYNLFLLLSKKISYIINISLFVGILGFFIVNFLFFYFLQYPFVVGDSYALGEKVTAEFIKHSWDGRKNIFVVKQEPGELYLETVFFFQNQQVTNGFLKNMEKFKNNTYELPNMIFKGECPKSWDKNTLYIIDHIKKCKPPFPNNFVIRNPRDAGVMFYIYNSNTCSGQSINKWVRFHYLSDYGMESMSKENFCQRWIST